MKQLALALSAFVTTIGAIGVMSPEALLGVARYFETPAGLYVAAGLRIVLGIALLIAASGSRAPGVVRVLGAAVFVAGLMTPSSALNGFVRSSIGGRRKAVSSCVLAQVSPSHSVPS